MENQYLIKTTYLGQWNAGDPEGGIATETVSEGVMLRSLDCFGALISMGAKVKFYNVSDNGYEAVAYDERGFIKFFETVTLIG